MLALIYFTAAFLSLLSHAQSARIIGLFPHTGRSHQMVFEPLLQKLAERGHHLTVVSFFPLANPPANYTDVSLEGIAALGLETIDLSIYENPETKVYKMLGVEKIVKQIVEFQPLADMALEVCSRLVDWQPFTEALKKDYDLILVENFNSDCMLGLVEAYGVKAPVVALLSSGMMHWSPERLGVPDNPSYVPTIGTTYSNRMSFTERLMNTLLQCYFNIWYRYAIQVKEQAIIEKHFGRKIVDMRELGKNMSLMLVNSHHTFAGARPLVPGVVEVGGMHLSPKRKVIPEFLERFMNESEHGVVLLSFGSLIKTATMPKYREEMIINALSKLEQRVIWKYEDSEDEGTLIGNILKVKWIPQYELLLHNKVVAFIAHGGLLGMTEAISAGKPILVVSFFGDQPFNGASATNAGFGRMIFYEDLTEKTLFEALQDVLSAEKRVNARRFSKIWSDRQASPIETAVYWVERVIRWGDQSPLYSTSRELAFFQYALLDVAAVILLAVIVLLLVLRTTLSLFLRFVTSNFGKEKKSKLH